ncbi:transmembrane protein 42 [Anabrus simplex]|uniref:transmembrane protein 42 n=1 Tax=Anabrus simplex TaxID=316456 RepID=UPI0035A2CDC9
MKFLTEGGLFYAVLAGISAAGGSLFMKLFGIQDTISNYSIVLQSVILVMVLVCNAAVWTFFAKALQHSSSSLPATVTSTATNYFCSVVMGFLLFGEVTSGLWWIGIFLVLTGLVLICHSQSKGIDKKKD